MMIQVALPQSFAGHANQIAQHLAAKNYQPLQVLGTGNFAMTVIASGQRGIVAIKVFLAVGPQKDTLERTARHEMRLAMQLQGVPHVVGALETWEAPPLFFLVLPYIHGETLASRIDRQRVHSSEQIIQLGEQIAEGLIELHRRKTIHRDVNPLNIMVTPEGYMYLIDFNISKDEQGTLQDFRKFGTPPYVAPEQYKGITNEQTDMYSWAIILASLALGTTKLPDAKERRDQEVPLALRASNPAIPVALEAVIEMAAALDPAWRFVDMRAAAKALKSGQAPVAQPVPAKVAQPPTVQVAVPQLPPLPMKKNQCPACGQQHKALPAYCDGCGRLMDPAVAAVQIAKPQQIAQVAKVQARATPVSAASRPAGHHPGQPPFLIDPFGQFATLVFGGALRLGGPMLSTFGQLMVTLHYLNLLILVFFGIGYGLVWMSGNAHNFMLMVLAMIVMSVWFCWRTLPNGYTCRNYMQARVRFWWLVVSDVACIGTDYFLVRVLGTPQPVVLGLLLGALLCVAGIILHYVALEIWLN